MCPESGQPRQERELIGVSEVAQRCRVSRKTVLSWLSRGRRGVRLDHSGRIGSSYLIHTDDLKRFLMGGPK